MEFVLRVAVSEAHHGAWFQDILHIDQDIFPLKVQVEAFLALFQKFQVFDKEELDFRVVLIVLFEEDLKLNEENFDFSLIYKAEDLLSLVLVLLRVERGPAEEVAHVFHFFIQMSVLSLSNDDD
jgi:hypothetical protein